VNLPLKALTKKRMVNICIIKETHLRRRDAR